MAASAARKKRKNSKVTVDEDKEEVFTFEIDKASIVAQTSQRSPNKSNNTENE